MKHFLLTTFVAVLLDVKTSTLLKTTEQSRE
jgi:hypothetical protein